MDPYQNPPGMPGSGAVTPPAEQVSGPAILLMVTAGLGAVAALFSLISSAAGGGRIPPELLSNPDLAKYAPLIEKSQAAGSFSNFLVLVLSGVVFYGALKMKGLQNFGLSMAAAIIAMVPCVGPCCCIGIPAGIWALVVLNKPEVKSAFRP